MEVDISQLWLLLVLMLAIGGVAGIVAGLLGVGGGIVLVPAFYYTFSNLGYDSSQIMQICVATSLATIVVTSIRSVISHSKKGAVEWDVLRLWGAGIVVGAILGVLIAKEMKSETLMIVFGIIGILVGLYMAFGRNDWRLGGEMPSGWVRILISPIIGFLSVLMGIGGGSFGVPLMTLYGITIHRAVATAAGFGFIIALPSVVGFMLVGWDVSGKPPYTIGYVNIPAFIIIVMMTLVTAPIGVRIAHSLNPKPLKKIFAVFIMIMAINMLRKALMG